MNKILRTMVAGCAGLMSTVSLMAQECHFPDVKWKKKETDHFAIYAHDTDHDPARKYGEKLFDLTADIVPALKKDFEQNEFRTPDNQQVGSTECFRYSVYLTEDVSTFQKMAQKEEASGRDMKGAKMVGNYVDTLNRYIVLCKVDPRRTDGKERDMSANFIHAGGGQLVSGRAKSRCPLWFTAGYGYYAEHKLTKKCRIYYIDFNKYYESQDDEMIKGGLLNSKDSWTRPLRVLCKKGVVESLEAVCSVKVETMTPNISGYIFGLTYFLVSQPEKYAKLLDEARAGTPISKEQVLKVYGYEDDKKFEEAWYDFIKSSKFK